MVLHNRILTIFVSNNHWYQMPPKISYYNFVSVKFLNPKIIKSKSQRENIFPSEM